MEFTKSPENKGKGNEIDKYGINYENEKPNYFKETLKWIFVVIISIFIALVLRAFVFEWVIVRGPSMENTLYNQQVLFVNKLGYEFGEPKRGEIIIFEVVEGNIDYLPIIKDIPIISTLLPRVDEVNYIKRVIGVPGDEISILDGKVYVNGIMQDESYTKGTTIQRSFELPCVVPENQIFVMGDNREVSEDSRQFGFVDIDKIKGKALFRIRPLKEFGNIYD